MAANQPKVIGAAELQKLRDYISPQLKAAVGNEVIGEKELVNTLEKIFATMNINLPEEIKGELFTGFKNEFLGFGPIQVLLDDPDVSEVMVNGPKNVYVERRGNLEKSDVTFKNDAQVIEVIQKIVHPLGRLIDFDHPTVDARLPDGSRVNAVVPPVAIDGPSITIRKFAKERLKVQDLINYGSLTEDMATLLEACVNAKLNIVVSGGTGSGKTTLLNILSSFIPEKERIVTIEDAAELQMQQDHVVRMETKAPNLQGTGEVTIRDLVRNSLRMRPDRIVIGEVRGGEALDMLQAMNTGHDGSLTTVHSNSPRDAIARLETLTLMAGVDLPVRIVREQIASAVDVIVQQSRLTDGSRKVTYITEISGIEGDRVVMTDLFKFEQTGASEDGKMLGEHKPLGIRPLFMPRLKAAGYDLKPAVFIPR